MNTHIYHVRSTGNLGDYLEDPSMYWLFDNVAVHDIFEKDVSVHADDDLFIFGGGGLWHPSLLEAMQKLLPKIHGKTVFIGGSNYHDTKMIDVYPEMMSRFDLLGFRDYTEASLRLAKYCPPMCCMNPLFDKYRNTIPSKDVFVYSHKDFKISMDDNSVDPEGVAQKFDKVLQAMADAKYIITTSYHGMLFAHYMKRPCVVVAPHSTKFFMTRFTPRFSVSLEQAKKDLPLAIAYPDALERDRESARVFKSSINRLAEGKLSVHYALRSPNLGDNLSWIAESLKHASIKKIHRVHISSNISPVISPLFPQVNYVGPSMDAVDRIYNLGIVFSPEWRRKSVPRIGQDILGTNEKVARIDLTPLAGSRPIQDKYLTFASRSSSSYKEWQYPDGWNILKKLVKQELGMDMIDCSLEAQVIPKDLQSGAITYIFHSEAFVGGPSGLAWVADALGKNPIVLSGITKRGTEMPSCIRVDVDDEDCCKHCYHDNSLLFSHTGCPRNKGFECWKRITPERVLEAIKNLITRTNKTN